jgi:hypothetical protein
MKLLRLLLCLVLLAGVAQTKSDTKKVLVCGRIARLPSGQVFVFPQAIVGYGFVTATKTNPEVSGLRLFIENKFTNGEVFLGIGLLDSIEGCFEPEWWTIGDIIEDYGILIKDSLNSVGQIIPIDTAKAKCLKNGSWSNIYELEGTEVEVFGIDTKDGLKVLAITESISGFSRFCGTVTGKQETGITDFEAARKYGKTVEKLKILAQKNPQTLFLNGSGAANFDSLSTGRLGYCAGFFNAQSGIMQATAIVSGLNSSVFGGRIFGIVTSVGQNEISMRTMLPGCVPATVRCVLNNCTVIKDNERLEGYPSPTSFAIPGKTVVEAFGKFENDQFVFTTTLARIDPDMTSSYVCGFFKGNDIFDVFGGKTFYIPSKAMKLLDGTAIIEDGVFVRGWQSKGEMVAVSFPKPGLLGVNATGILREKHQNSLVIECTDAFDYRLFGRKLEVFLDGKSKIVDPKRGFVSPSSLEPGAVLRCWGYVDEKLEYWLVMADLD